MDKILSLREGEGGPLSAKMPIIRQKIDVAQALGSVLPQPRGGDSPASESNPIRRVARNPTRAPLRRDAVYNRPILIPCAEPC